MPAQTASLRSRVVRPERISAYSSTLPLMRASCGRFQVAPRQCHFAWSARGADGWEGLAVQLERKDTGVPSPDLKLSLRVKDAALARWDLPIEKWQSRPPRC